MENPTVIGIMRFSVYSTKIDSVAVPTIDPRRAAAGLTKIRVESKLTMKKNVDPTIVFFLL